jgi:long-subunit acyl-CoA synthetase (AMP-forming)
MHEFFEGLLHQAAVSGDSAALVSANDALSYGALVERVRGHAQWATRLPHRVGLLFMKGTDYVVCDLALSFAGKELVPLPEFFSDAQLLHIVHVAQLSDVVADRASAERAKRLGLTVHELDADSVTNLAPATGAGRVIFTSGTTGRPKGVCLSERQLLASVAALAEASCASATDRYLSVLPNSLLLEQIAGTYLPLSVGAAIHLPGVLAASPAAQLAAAEQARATATVLVPELLAAWVKELQARGDRAPGSLRFIAVGGAPISQHLAAAAWQRGLPVYEGYGLSECSSVVCVNRPDARRAGTVGRPLSNVAVAIDEGEIVVCGPTVMNGYVGELRLSGSWHTGDLGHLDADGFLIVTGRKDDVIVTATGRNISPEWVEDVIAADSRVGRCVVVAHEGELVALIIPTDSSVCGDSPAMHDLVASAARALPDYAKPRRYLAMSDQEFRRLDLLTANSRPRRSEVSQIVAERSRSLQVQGA